MPVLTAEEGQSKSENQAEKTFLKSSRPRKKMQKYNQKGNCSVWHLIGQLNLFKELLLLIQSFKMQTYTVEWNSTFSFVVLEPALCQFVCFRSADNEADVQICTKLLAAGALSLVFFFSKSHLAFLLPWLFQRLNHLFSLYLFADYKSLLFPSHYLLQPNLPM